MNPQERALYEALAKDAGAKRLPDVWARTAWPTAFVCKRTKKVKASQSIQNALHKAAQLLEVFAEKGLISKEWAWIEEKEGHRQVYWKEKPNDKASAPVG